MTASPQSQPPFWLPMIVVRQRELSAREQRRQERAMQAQARAERNTRIATLFKSGRTSGQIARRIGMSETNVRTILREAGLTWKDGGAHLRAQQLTEKSPQRLELERLIRKHRRHLPPEARTVEQVLIRQHLPLTTAG